MPVRRVIADDDNTLAKLAVEMAIGVIETEVDQLASGIGRIYL